MKKLLYILGGVAVISLLVTQILLVKNTSQRSGQFGFNTVRSSDSSADTAEVSIGDKNYLGKNVEITPMGALRTAQTVRLVGSAFTGDTVDNNFWATSTVANATVTQPAGNLLLKTGSSASASSTIASIRTGRYVASASNMYRAIVQQSAVNVASNRREWGVGDTSDGAFFRLNSTTGFELLTRKNSVETVIASTTFSGTQFTMDTNAHTYEIYYSNKTVYWTIDDVLIHKGTFNTGTWTANMSLKLWAMNGNSVGAGSTDVSMFIRVMSISRLGELLSQEMSKTQAGTTAGTILKYGAGNLHNVIISNVSNSAVVTLYDGTSTGGTIMFTSGSMGAQTIPFDLDFDGIPFANGLFLVISGATANATVTYE